LRKKNNHTDLQLVEQAKKGDNDAFSQLVESYKNLSFSLACSVLHDEQDAEDALQDAFIKVYQNIRQFRGQSTFSTWLYRIVVNTCYTHVKKRQKQHLQVDIETRKEMELPQCESTFDELTATEQKQIINRAMELLKPEESLLLKLFYLSELDVKEVMQITGFGESKVKVTLHRGRKRLQKILEKSFGNELSLV
jgi:RNA polymerase sigma-70 factor (ECF subfamily)